MGATKAYRRPREQTQRAGDSPGQWGSGGCSRQPTRRHWAGGWGLQEGREASRKPGGKGCARWAGLEGGVGGSGREDVGCLGREEEVA